MKKTIAMLLILALSAALLSVPAMAEESRTVDFDTAGVTLELPAAYLDTKGVVNAASGGELGYHTDWFYMEADYVAMEQEGLLDHPQRVNYEGFEISIPSKEFAVFFTFFHAWHHYLKSGVGWRQLTDVAMTLHAYYGQLDIDKLHRWLTSMYVMKPWQTFGYLLVDCLGLPQEELPFFDVSCKSRAQRLYRQIMKDGNFKRTNTFKRKKPKSRLWHKVHAFIGIFVDFFHCVGVFPLEAFREWCNEIQVGFGKNFQKK